MREFLGTLQEHADWSVISTQSKEWIVNKLAGQLFLHDEAKIGDWNVQRASLLGPDGSAPSFWHAVQVLPHFANTNIAQAIVAGRRRYEQEHDLGVDVQLCI